YGNASFSQIEEIVDRLHAAGSQNLTRCKFGGLYLCRKFGELRLTVAREPVKNIREKYRNELRESLGVGRAHIRDAGIIRPERIDRFDQTRPQIVTEDCFDLLGRGLRDRFIGFYARKSEHGFADNPDSHPAQRTARARRSRACGIWLIKNAGSRDRGENIA